jgi:ArsR family transcriptional regulator
MGIMRGKKGGEKREMGREARLAEVMRGCADGTRLRILNLLGRGGEVCVCHLVGVLGESQPKVSRHLGYLRGVGLVEDRKDGLWVHYGLAGSLEEGVVEVLAALREACREGVEADMARLEAVRRKQPILRLTARGAAPVEDATSASRHEPAARRDLEIELL